MKAISPVTHSPTGKHVRSRDGLLWLRRAAFCGGGGVSPVVIAEEHNSTWWRW